MRGDPVRLCLGVVLLMTCARAETISALSARGYSVLPPPRQVELQERDVRFGPEWSLERGPGVTAADAAPLEEELRSRFGLQPPGTGPTAVRLSIQPGNVQPRKHADSDAAAIGEQAYRLEIGASSVTIAANARAGLFYGIVTLVQLLRPRDGALYLPEGRILDWPDLHLRHIYWDDAHHLERLPELKRALRQAAFFKINGFALKLEGHFQFRSAPALVEPYALTPAEYQELTDYGLRYHLQVIPYLDAPAHIAFILKHPQYAKFRAFPDSNYEMCVANPDAVSLLRGMLQDLVDANRGGRFVYLSTDEPYYVGMADNPQCREKGIPGKVLAEFIGRVANPLHEQGRTVIFWGEYPLKPADIAALPAHLVNGEVYGPAYDPVFRQHGIRQMIYTATEGEERLFPDYFPLPDSQRLHPAPNRPSRVADGFGTISFQPARGRADLMGAVVAGWGDMGLHPETFWAGYATIAAAGWAPGSAAPQELMASFYRWFYGAGAVRPDRVYQLMSRQAQFWDDSWETAPSTRRKPIFGNSNAIYDPRQPAMDQVLPLPPPPGPDLHFDATWLQSNARRLQLASEALAENDELLALLHENTRTARFNGYNLEVFIAVARLCRQNLDLLVDIGRMASLLEAAQRSAGERKPAQAVESLDRALGMARGIRDRRNAVLRDATATWYKSWQPRVAEANGRVFLHEVDDVKDHLPDRTVDMSYLIYRDLQLPFGGWVEAIRAARNAYARSNGLALNDEPFDWRDLVP